MPMLSFVVIAYNVESYIADCLESLKCQTYADFEVVVVDDASTDSTKAVIEDQIDGDDRFRLIGKKRNEGSHLARKTGVLASHGQYVIFVDGDDELEPSAGEVLMALAVPRTFDILRFGRQIIACGENNQGIGAEERSFNVPMKEQHGMDIVRSVFSEDFTARSTWSLIDCMFAGDFVRNVFASMTDERLGRMEDSYEFFVLASRAQTMLFFTEYRGLRYHFGAGVSGHSMESLDRFEQGQRGIHSSLTAAIRYAHKTGNEVVYACAQWFEHVVLGIVGREWAGRLGLDDQIEAVLSLREEWGDACTAAMMLDPLTARAQWFNEQDAVPTSDDPYSRWITVFETLDLKDTDDTYVVGLIARFREQKRLIDERRDRIAAEREAAAQIVEDSRILKTGTFARRVIDRLLPEDSRGRSVIRAVLRKLLRR